MTDRAALLARIEALERESRRAFDDAQREADALFAQYQLSQLVASGGSLADLARSVALEAVRLAAVDGGALWLGVPDEPSLRRVAMVGSEVRLGRARRRSTGWTTAASGPPDCPAAGPSPSPRSHRSSCWASGRTTDAPPIRTGSGSSSWPATSWPSRSRGRGCARSSSANARS